MEQPKRNKIILCLVIFSTFFAVAYADNNNENQPNNLAQSTRSRPSLKPIPSERATIDQISAQYLGAHYDHSGPLGEGPGGEISRKPLMDYKRFDCTTFVETVLAQFIAVRTSADFQLTLNRIRYRDGRVDYLERNHVVELDWIPNNTRAGFVRDITQDIAPQETHNVKVKLSRQTWLENRTISDIQRSDLTEEQKLNLLHTLQTQNHNYPLQRVIIPYISLQDFRSNTALAARIPSGSIFNVVRAHPFRSGQNIGTIISHQGFIIRKDNRTYVRHATDTVPAKVKDELLENYLEQLTVNRAIVGLNILGVQL